MNLADLGFDRWFEERSIDLSQPDQCVARITAVDRDAFLARNEHGEFIAELSGKFRFSAASEVDLPCVGDWVCVRIHSSGGPALIQSVFPRRSSLRRKAPGTNRSLQMIAANIDAAFVVQGCGYDFNLARLDRYLVTVQEGGIEPWIVLSKTDLISTPELEQLIDQLRFNHKSDRVLPLSNLTGAGLEEFKSLLTPAKTYCLLGSSGVGKTTLINRLIGSNAFEIRPVSQTGEGVHTTTRRQLLALENGALLIDTPGMRELGLAAATVGMNAVFSEFEVLAENCRYTNCTHANEPGCAVRTAVKNGELSEERYRNYLKLKKETEFHELSEIERRQKDKQFGRFIKSVKKQLKNKRSD